MASLVSPERRDSKSIVQVFSLLGQIAKPRQTRCAFPKGIPLSRRLLRTRGSPIKS